MGGSGSETHKGIKIRLRQTRAAIAGEFGTLGTDNRELDGERLPRPSEVVEHFGRRWGDARQWTGIYDYLCATANHPSLNPLEYFAVVTPPSPSSSIPPDLLGRLTRAALVPFLKALEHYARYMGWSSDLVDHYIDEVNEVLGEVLT